MSQPLHVLAVEPFYGGSHRAYLDGVVRHSRHRWTLVTGKPVHWKWRSRSGPLQLALAAQEAIQNDDLPDVIFVSEMLDLPCWRGMLRLSPLAGIPAVVYFHENQWTYPLSPMAVPDFHFGYTNLLTALAADAVCFNSAFHRDEFLSASETFVRRMPDARGVHDFAGLREISQVLPPGFDPPDDLMQRSGAHDSGMIRIGWVSRWEYDKRPDLFLDVVTQLEAMGVDYQLLLVGARPKETPAALRTLRDEFAARIAHDGYASTSQEYWRLLQSMDVVVSTADHEFFGIAICEAIWAGAAPVLPRRLSYREIVSDESLYDDTQQAATMIANLRDDKKRRSLQAANHALIANLQMKHTVKRLDDRLAEVVS